MEGTVTTTTTDQLVASEWRSDTTLTLGEWLEARRHANDVHVVRCHRDDLDLAA
jgi:hypothetical protein